MKTFFLKINFVSINGKKKKKKMFNINKSRNMNIEQVDTQMENKIATF